MKILRYLLILSIVTFAAPAFSQNIITNDEVSVTITGETTREELATLRQDLLAVGIDFKYYPAFNGERKLMGLKGDFTADAQHTGNVDNQNLSNVNQKIQFRMKKENGAITNWCTGTCPQ